MYNDKKYGGIKYKSFPKTEYDKLELKYEEKINEVKEYKEKNIQLEESLHKSFDAICDNCSNCSKVDNVYKSFNL